MGRPATKTDLLTAAAANYEKLNTLVSGLTEKELSTPFDFSGDEKKKETHWKRDKNLRDIFIHLYEWHQPASLEDAKNMFQKSHNEVIKLAETFSNEELFSKGVYIKVQAMPIIVSASS